MYYYWKSNGKMYGPTIRFYSTSITAETERRSLHNEILEKTGWSSIPEDLEIVPKMMSSNDRNKKLRELVNSANDRLVREIFRGVDLPCAVEIRHGTMYPEVGNVPISFDVCCSHIAFHTTKDPNKRKQYNLLDEKQKKRFIKEVRKRLDERVRRAKKSKKIGGTRTTIGHFEMDTEDTIQSAQFDVFIDEGKMVDADASLVGYVKFFRRPRRPCTFDIDNGKIVDMQGNIVQARNADMVLQQLINCLANRRDND